MATTLVLLSVAVAHSAAQEPPPVPLVVHLFPDTRQAGVITLSFFGALGTPVVFYERVGGVLQPIGTRTTPTGQATVIDQAVTWRCDRRLRQFVAITVAPDGRQATAAYDVRTPTCKTRFELDAPPHVARGKVGRIRVLDRWNNGDVSVDVCVKAPREKSACTPLKFARAVSVVTHRFRPETAGRWRAELRFRGNTIRRSIAVGDGRVRITPPLSVLATGDSSMQGIDSFLADELGDTATVRSDLHPGTGLAKPGGPWAQLPAFQTRVAKQAVTVMSIGAADDFRVRAFDGSVHDCCDEAWITEYTGRVRQTMQIYLRGGKARVIWLTLPIPRGDRPLATAAVNTAIVNAAAGLPGVTALRTDLVFTPDGYREFMSYRGNTMRVFREDGVHLTLAGSAIAANLVAAAVRAR